MTLKRFIVVKYDGPFLIVIQKNYPLVIVEQTTITKFNVVTIKIFCYNQIKYILLQDRLWRVQRKGRRTHEMGRIAIVKKTGRERT